ncbi:hypothetical protein [Microcella sp.]|uniref:hypothetical protein n=1 Tax=Microcella sp. TaxID=1913979 RepID=UPI003919E884
MSEDLSTADDARLARWAYGRPGTDAEAARAQSAAEELERRAIERDAAARAVAGAGAVLTPAARASPLGHGAITSTAPIVDAQSSTDPTGPADHEPRPRGRRVAAIVGAGALLAVIAGVALPPLLDTQPATASSLAVFDRDDSAEEREYLTLLLRQGQTVSLGPRVLGTIEYGTVIAYRVIRDEPASDLVCLAIAEFDRAAQTPVIADRQCLDRGEFEAAGASMTLFGIGGQYDVDWGPHGRAQLDVLMTDAQRRAMDPGIEGVFLDITETADDLRYLTEQPLIEQTGLAVEQLRRIFPVPALIRDTAEVGGPTVTPQTEWVAAYTAVPVRPIEQGESSGAADAPDRVACLAIVADGVQRESRCVAFADLGSRGMLLEFEREGRTNLVSWSTTGEISAQTASTE